MSGQRSTHQPGEKKARDAGSDHRNVSEDVVTQLDSLPELDDENEPLSLAEEIAAESGNRPADETNDRYERIKQGEIHIAELQRMSMSDLIEEARKENVKDVTGLKKQDLIFKILKERVKMNGLMYGEGTLEILPDGFGFLRSPDYHYLSCPDDIYVSPSQIRRFGLQTGATVSGQIRPPKENERYFALLRVEAINYQDPNSISEKIAVRAALIPTTSPKVKIVPRIKYSDESRLPRSSRHWSSALKSIFTTATMRSTGSASGSSAA